jgi:molybdenum-dependent DNA-binding transcriptional regulator ModE
MLSPHEFATLMLVRHAPDQIDMNRAELDALLERQLVMLERSGEGISRAQLTEMGRSYLEAFSPEYR